MPIKAYRFRSWPPVLLAVAGFSVAGSFATPSRSQESVNYTISNNDGYGIADCMQSGTDCGRVMANSWCEAHGYAHALAYGSSQELAGSIAASNEVVKVAAGDVMIRCGD